MLIETGGVDAVISPTQLDAHVDGLVEQCVLERGLRRVLLVPPDHTRLHSQAGRITARFYRRLADAGVEVAVMPALGTHAPMTPAQCGLLFGRGAIPYDAVRPHRWRDDLVTLGELSADEVAHLSDGRYAQPLPVMVNQALLEGWDLVVSPGQVVPHEVVGLANYTKNLMIGLGGRDLIHRSHFLGAVCGMESAMGRVDTPVRAALDRAFDRFLAPRVQALFVLTVVQDTAGGVVQRGLFAGVGGPDASGGAAFRAAGALARAVNVQCVDEPIARCACWLDPEEFHSTWLGNKAVYRTRMAMADGGELLVLAPGVRSFGEDPAIDALIRRHGYRGTPATLAALETDPGLADNLAAAAHLIHGSSAGRFRVVYCTDPSAGGLPREAVESAGYTWRPLRETVRALGIDAGTPDGARRAADGGPLTFIRNPALGLWSLRSTWEQA
jgi:nickel-dependent lactate racemase